MKSPFSKGFLLTMLFFAVLPALSVWAAEEKDASDSSQCVACHTDLEEMDDYGAKAASAAAAVAG